MAFAALVFAFVVGHCFTALAFVLVAGMSRLPVAVGLPCPIVGTAPTWPFWGVSAQLLAGYSSPCTSCHVVTAVSALGRVVAVGFVHTGLVRSDNNEP